MRSILILPFLLIVSLLALAQRPDSITVDHAVAVAVVEVTGIAHAVAVRVGLRGIGHLGTHVAGVAEPVAVGVELVVVGCVGAVVLGVADAVVVAIAGGRERVGERRVCRGARVCRGDLPARAAATRATGTAATGAAGAAAAGAAGAAAARATRAAPGRSPAPRRSRGC